MNKKGQQVEDSVHNTRRVIQADNDILWTNKLTGNFPDYDK